MKQGSLFCFVLFCTDEIHRTGMLQIAFLVSLESSRGWSLCKALEEEEEEEEGCIGLVSWRLDLQFRSS